MDLWKKDPILSSVCTFLRGPRKSLERSAIELRDLVLLRQKIETHQVSMEGGAEGTNHPLSLCFPKAEAKSTDRCCSSYDQKMCSLGCSSMISPTGQIFCWLLQKVSISSPKLSLDRGSRICWAGWSPITSLEHWWRTQKTHSTHPRRHGISKNCRKSPSIIISPVNIASCITKFWPNPYQFKPKCWHLNPHVSCRKIAISVARSASFGNGQFG